MEIPAPVQAYEGLQELNEAITETTALPFEEEPVAMLPVSSSMAIAVGYDRDEHILQVEFQNGGVYQYLGVDEDTWEDLHASDLIGSFYNQEIKGQNNSKFKIINFIIARRSYVANAALSVGA